eukprot:m.50417 g.50417  ORF g.50417 m.50417 type:complete len:280 (+) comp6224_c0_seq1:114-953(+)
MDKAEPPPVDQELRDLYNGLTMGLVASLEKRPGIVDVRVRPTAAVMSSHLGGWESTHRAVLPTDLKNYLLTVNGMDLCWSVTIAGAACPVGRMHVHAMSELSVIDARPPADASEEGCVGSVRLFFSPPLVEIDACDGDGAVCVVGDGRDTSVWFRDRSERYHRIAGSFTEYFRLMVAHLGIPGWQYALTSIGLSPIAAQWFHQYAPSRLVINAQGLKAFEPTVAAPSADLSKILQRINELSMPSASPSKAPSASSVARRPAAPASASTPSRTNSTSAKA